MSKTDPQKRKPHPNRCFWEVQTLLLPSDLALNNLVEQIFSFFFLFFIFFPTASHVLEASVVTLTKNGFCHVYVPLWAINGSYSYSNQAQVGVGTGLDTGVRFEPISCKLFLQLISDPSPNFYGKIVVTYCTILGNYSINFCCSCTRFLLRVCWRTTLQAPDHPSLLNGFLQWSTSWVLIKTLQAFVFRCTS